MCLLLGHQHRYIDIQTLFYCATIYLFFKKRLSMPLLLFQCFSLKEAYGAVKSI